MADAVDDTSAPTELLLGTATGMRFSRARRKTRIQDHQGHTWRCQLSKLPTVAAGESYRHFMPRISAFYGVVIYMYWNERDHPVAHFHAYHAGRRTSVSVDGTVLAGALEPRALAFVRDWAKLHRADLLANWERARRNEPLLAIPPLPRLKGGDPFVFGRGHEEVEAWRAAGVPVEVIPGVTSAISVPAAAGIPVTHRGLSQGFCVVAGHASPADSRSTVAWAALARSGLTLVLLMAIEHLDGTAAALVAAGLGVAPRAPMWPMAGPAGSGW